MNADNILNKKSRTSIVLFCLPLALSAFTHIWNPIGFPSLYVDEGHYLRRAMLVSEHLTLKEGEANYNEYHSYDHPFFSQLFLGGIFEIIGYPDLLNPIPGDKHSVEMLYLVPRVLMGVLAVVDTFLIYKILERRYNRNVALIASVLFAVMPLSWLVRRILLESIQLPFILSSMLFALYSYDSKNDHYDSKKKILTITLSGLLLGIAIFTKISAFAFIPAIAYLIYVNNRKNRKTLALWLIPLTLIPSIWPAYAILHDEVGEWFEDISWQANRFYRSLFVALNTIFKIDPTLLLLGLAGLVYTSLKRDYFPILWCLPFLFFLDTVGYTQYFHLIPLIPLFCITSSMLIEGIHDWVVKKKVTSRSTLGRYLLSTHKNNVYDTLDKYIVSDRIARVNKFADMRHHFSHLFRSCARNLQFVIALVIGIFGLASTIMLISTNLNSVYFDIVTYIVQSVTLDNSKYSQEVTDKVTMIGARHWGIHYLWIPKHVFDKNLEFREYKDKQLITGNETTILIVDKKLRDLVLAEDNNNETKVLRALFNNTMTKSIFNDNPRLDRSIYPYTSLQENRRIDIVEIRSNAERLR